MAYKPHDQPINLPTVADLTARRLARLPHVAIKASIEHLGVIQTFHDPERGDVEVLYTLDQTIEIIRALVSEGTTLARERWVKWITHLSFVHPGAGSAAAVYAYVRAWRDRRPDIYMRAPEPSRTVVVAAATEIAEAVLSAHTHAGTAEQLSAMARTYLEHFTYEGQPLIAWPSCPQGRACEWVVPWNLL